MSTLKTTNWHPSVPFLPIHIIPFDGKKYDVLLYAWKPAFSNPVTNMFFIDNCVLNSLVFSLTAYASWCPWWGLHNRQRGEQFLAQNPVPSGPPMSGNASTYPNSTHTLTYIQTLFATYTYSQFLHFKWMQSSRADNHLIEQPDNRWRRLHTYFTKSNHTYILLVNKCSVVFCIQLRYYFNSHKCHALSQNFV